MPGRIRRQLQVVKRVRDAAKALDELIHKSAPTGMLTYENILACLGDRLSDPKAELWCRMSYAVSDCVTIAEQLGDLIAERVQKLPTVTLGNQVPAIQPENPDSLCRSR